MAYPYRSESMMKPLNFYCFVVGAADGRDAVAGFLQQVDVDCLYHSAAVEQDIRDHETGLLLCLECLRRGAGKRNEVDLEVCCLFDSSGRSVLRLFA